jgi:tetratricopeptide (TPR) repeat protein
MANLPLFLLLAALFLAALPVSAQSWGQLKSQAQEAQAAGSYGEAVQFWLQAVSACDNTTGPRYIQSMSGLAGAYAGNQQYADAEACYKKIVELAASGNLSDECKSALADYVSVLHKEKKETEAAELEAKYSLQTKPLGQAEEAAAAKTARADQTAERTNVLNNWQTLVDSGAKGLAEKHYSVAEQHFKQALAAAETAGGNSKLKSVSLGRLINLYLAQGKYAQAEPYYRASLELTGKSSGMGSKDYAHALMNYGQLLRKLDRKQEAMVLEAKAERILYGSGSGSQPAGSSAGTQSVDTSLTRRGSLYQRARAAQSGFNDATNQAINSPE